MQTNEIYKISIIGAGQIAAFYDKPDQAEILSHAHAFKVHDRFKLLGFYDVDMQKAKEAALMWQVQAFNSVEELLSQKTDVIVIATSDDYHYEYLKLFHDKEIKLIFCEKPIATSLIQLEEIYKLYENNKIKVLINYSRRFVLAIQNIRNRIDSGEFGKLLYGSAYYGKGLMHNGSHMIDLINMLFDGGKSIISVGEKIDDYLEEDNSISAIIKIDNQGSISINAINQKNYTIFELDLLFEKKRVQMLDGCAKIIEYDICEDETYAGYKILKQTKNYSTHIFESLPNAVENILNILDHKSNKTNLKDSLSLMKFCMQIKN